ncbi:GNAT family protein [Polaribacter sp.]|uniref:GNAT family N-acetyltransferase n=1 Tax=Polaribacter sp. TaxID=1920175 RepID=UPI0025E903AC|nr:GNAT family protein [Polaribacter sp.]
MKTLKGNSVFLRALEPEDLEYLFEIENNETFWEVSHTQTPFSKYVLKQYLENVHLDVFAAKQLRLMIVDALNRKNIGLIDLFDFNPKHKRAGIGILIDPAFQHKGFASESLELLIKYTFSHLELHQLYANITSDNAKSIKLFESKNFTKVGVKKDWISSQGNFKDEILYQLIND